MMQPLKGVPTRKSLSVAYATFVTVVTIANVPSVQTALVGIDSDPIRSTVGAGVALVALVCAFGAWWLTLRRLRSDERAEQRRFAVWRAIVFGGFVLGSFIYYLVKVVPASRPGIPGESVG
jgi:cytochrome bd-type quinol oxidase subunit 2